MTGIPIVRRTPRTLRRNPRQVRIGETSSFWDSIDSLVHPGKIVHTPIRHIGSNGQRLLALVPIEPAPTVSAVVSAPIQPLQAPIIVSEVVEAQPEWNIAFCEDCGAEIQVQSRDLGEYGPPLCACNSLAMECDEYEQMRELESAASMPSTIKDAEVKCRTPHPCGSCGTEIAIGDTARNHVYRQNGELHNTYTCWLCTTHDTRARSASASEWKSELCFNR